MTLTETQEGLVEEVRDHWEKLACGAQNTSRNKYSKAYFEEIEEHRYSVEPEIFSFAQFTRHHGQRVLEIGVGAATDFTQWVRAGAEAYGIDLTQEAVAHAKNRLSLYGLEAADVRRADCEELPFENDSFDLIYSWGVIHHSPNPPKALAEAVRVLRPGGTGKIMLYHRHSLVAFYQWVKWALLKGKPWRTPSWCIYHCVESLGTKAYTKKEVLEMLSNLPVEDISFKPILTRQDRLEGYNKMFRLTAKVLGLLFGGNSSGWYLTILFKKQKTAV